MSSLQYIIDSTVETIETIGPDKYTVKDTKVDDRLVESTKLPLVLISSTISRFGQPLCKQMVTEYEITLLVILNKAKKNDDTGEVNRPFALLEDAQDEIAKTLYTKFHKNVNLVSDSFELRTSTVSNTTKQHNFGGGVSCMISFVCSVVKDFSV